MNSGEEIVDKSDSQQQVGSDAFDDNLMNGASFFDDFLNEEEEDGVVINPVSQKAKELELYYLNSDDTTHDDIPARQELLADLPSLAHAQPEITLSVGALTTADLPEELPDDLDYDIVQNFLFEMDGDWSTLDEPVDAYHQVELDENFDSDFHNAATTISTPHSQGSSNTTKSGNIIVRNSSSSSGGQFGEHEKLEADAPPVTTEPTRNTSCSSSSSSSSSSLHECDTPAAASGSKHRRATKRSSVASQQLVRHSSCGSQQQELTSSGSLFSEHNFMTVHLDQVERLQAELARPTLSRDEIDAIYAQIAEYQTHIAKRQRALDHVARGRQLVEQQRREVLFYERVHSDFLQTATQLRDMQVHSLAPAQAPQQLSNVHNHWHQQIHQPPQPPLSNDNSGSSNNGRRRVLKREDIL